MLFMAFDFSQGRLVVRDSGEEVRVLDVPFTRWYSNPEMERLRGDYDIHDYPGFVASTLGSAGLESFVGALFEIYSFVGGPCGVKKAELKRFGELIREPFYVGRVEERGLLVLESIGGEGVLFPTEELFQNQKMKKREQ